MKHRLPLSLGLISSLGAAGPALAHNPRHAPLGSARSGETHQGPTYAGDCRFPYPPGYRYDLRHWRTGFDRDFSCYMLDDY
jgi:hypothetical protein